MAKVTEVKKPLNKPVATFRLGYVQATVWKNGEHYNTNVTRSYKDGDTWKDGESFSSGDLLNLAKTAERAEQFISEQV